MFKIWIWNIILYWKQYECNWSIYGVLPFGLVGCNKVKQCTLCFFCIIDYKIQVLPTKVTNHITLIQTIYDPSLFPIKWSCASLLMDWSTIKWEVKYTGNLITTLYELLWSTYYYVICLERLDMTLWWAAGLVKQRTT